MKCENKEHKDWHVMSKDGVKMCLACGKSW